MNKAGTVKIENHKIIVTNPEGKGRNATLTPAKLGQLFVNGIHKTERTLVKEEDSIVYELKNEELCREFKVDYLEHNLKAVASVEYRTKRVFAIKDVEEEVDQVIQVEQVLEEVPKTFSQQEIFNFIKLKGINYGLKGELINKIANGSEVKEEILAEGKTPIEPKDDLIKFLFNNNDKVIEENSLQSIDYKNANKINSVSKGEVIAEIITGYEGEDGKDVFGKEIKPKRKNRAVIKNGVGCAIQNDKVIATNDGQVSFKNNIISINELYSVNKDVDISTGNINFQGNIAIQGNVTEGMSVCALNDILITKAVYKSNVISMGDITINGNVIDSRVSAGGECVTNLERVDKLEKLKTMLDQINEAIGYLGKKNVDINHDFVKVMQSIVSVKASEINDICKEVIFTYIKQKDLKSKVLLCIRERLLGVNITRIKSQQEFIEIIDVIADEIEKLKEESFRVSTINIGYCQESSIKASGDIVINGKGVFSTDAIALGKIIFSNKKSVCRGGHIKSNKGIEAGVVGSEGSAITILEVHDKDAIITADIAYTNTKMIIANKTYVFNKPAKNIKCYINKGELNVDKFVL